jgi:hypothetical protein
MLITSLLLCDGEKLVRNRYCSLTSLPVKSLSDRHRSSSLQELGSSTQGSFFELVPEIVGTPKLSSGKQPAAMPIR